MAEAAAAEILSLPLFPGITAAQQERVVDALRKALRLSGDGRRDPAGVFVHPMALCESDDVGAGTRVWAFAHVMAGAAHRRRLQHLRPRLRRVGGRHRRPGDGQERTCLVCDGVTVEDDVFLGPNMVFTNDRRPRAASVRDGPFELVPTLVRRGATIGANATIVCGVTVGPFALVAAGAVVTTDVPAHALVAGNPARRIGWVCRCGQSLPDELACRCGRAFRPVGDGLAPTGAEPEPA